jgi:glycosyltransferase involved in cell wall biosynthesis
MQLFISILGKTTDQLGSLKASAPAYCCYHPLPVDQLMSQPSISAIICTHNRADYLGAAIDSLLHQTHPNYEIIVVDNASTDNTRQVVEERLPHSLLTYVYEGKLGLSHARNRGAEVAKGEILAYLDDDAEASATWLSTLSQAFEDHASAAIAGGRVTLQWPPNLGPPRWLSAVLAENLGAYDLGPTIQAIQDLGATPRGLNYALRKTFLQEIDGFNPQLGRVGKNLLSNEELYMTQQALSRGVEVLYLPDAHVVHHVAPERLHPSWFLRRSWWQGVSECYRENLNQSLTPQRLRVRGMCMARGMVKAARGWRDPAQRFENLAYAYGQLGYVLSGIRYLVGYG